jgi:hypothetical protein
LGAIALPARHLYHETLRTANLLQTEQSRDNVRNRLLIGQIAVQAIFHQGGAQITLPAVFVIARYPYNPALHVWTQMRVYLETDDDESDTERITLDFRYTLDNGANWTALALDNTGDQVCGVLWREATIDLAALTNATWVGVAVKIDETVIGGASAERGICRAMVFLERPGF